MKNPSDYGLRGSDFTHWILLIDRSTPIQKVGYRPGQLVLHVWQNVAAKRRQNDQLGLVVFSRM
jgi:hypothetical protein